jgi:hypothetical protein
LDENLNITPIEMSYENIVAVCPFCGERNTFNRVSDLNDLNPIASKEVQCSNNNCKMKFRINGDIINQPYELLIFDCYKLIQDKRYSYCILNLAQSFEMFFALYLRVEVLYKPFAQEGLYDYGYLNKVNDKLEKKIKDLTFSGMRALFLNHIIVTRILMKRNAASLHESETILSQLTTNDPNRDVLSQVNDPKLAQLLIQVSQTKIGEKRNKVVHKSGYRPSLIEVEESLSETQKILYGILSIFGFLVDDINW